MGVYQFLFAPLVDKDYAEWSIEHTPPPPPRSVTVMHLEADLARPQTGFMRCRSAPLQIFVL